MRRKEREITDTNDILDIVNRAGILHLGLMDDGYPYIVPLHYGYEYDRENRTFIFYLHGAKEGHKLDLIRKNPHIGVELECDVELISGGEDACRYGAAYASFIGRGNAEIIEDAEEKLAGLNLLMENQTGRRFEMSETMAGAVTVIKLTVSDFSAKSRKKPMVK